MPESLAENGGRVQVDDAPQEGGPLSRVELPLCAPAGSPIAQGQPERPPAAPIRQVIEELRGAREPAMAQAPTGRPSVLVVEDNRDMAAFIVECLADQYVVRTALDGEEALEVALRLLPDLLISDVMMPRLSGDHLLERARARPELADTPVILLTAKADDELRVRLLRQGAQDYLVKPFAPEELRARVANQISRKRTLAVLQRELATQEKDLERLAIQIASQRRELAAALEAQQAAGEQATQALHAKTTFLSLVSHELRTPLAAIELHMHSLRNKPPEALDADSRRVVERLGESADRLGALIDSLLEYARIERGRVTLEVGDVNLANLARLVFDDLRVQADHKGIALDLRAPAGLPPVRSDARFVRHILANLIGNAVKFTGEGRVEVTLSCAGGTHRLEVRDTGPGIAAADLPRIFEPFTHLEPLRGKHTPGFGLGLTLVKQMAHLISAEVSVTSVPGQGTAFTVELASLP